MATSVNANNICLGSLREPQINTLASDYIAEHYEELAIEVSRMGAKWGMDVELRYDVLNAVYIKILEKESNGDCFNPNINGGCLNVEDYIRGMLSKYSRNKAYKKSSDRYYGGDDRYSEIPADGFSDTDKPSAIQLAYNNATDYSNMELLDDRMAAVQEIEFLLEFNSKLRIDMLLFIKSIRDIAEELSSKKISRGLFDELARMSEVNQEFKIALENVIKFAITQPVEFEDMVKYI